MTKLTAEELKGYSKEDMIALVMQMQEALAVSNAKQFGRKSETMECLGQVSLFNEAEMYADASVPKRPLRKYMAKRRPASRKKTSPDCPCAYRTTSFPRKNWFQSLVKTAGSGCRTRYI